MPECYEIKIRGRVDQRWSDWFAGLKLTHLEGNETLLSGTLPDQDVLHGLLERHGFYQRAPAFRIDKAVKWTRATDGFQCRGLANATRISKEVAK